MRVFTILSAAAAALFIDASGAAAQSGGGLCADPQSFCQRFMKPACLDALGAGSAAIGADVACSSQLDAYRTCIAAAAETCSPQAAGPNDDKKLGDVFTIASVSAKLRTEPSVSAQTKNVGYAASGSVVRLLEHGPDGRFVRIEVLAAAPAASLRGGRGWVPTDAIRPAPASAAPEPLRVGERALVETYTATFAKQPNASGTILASMGWVKRGSMVEVLDRFVDPTDGAYVRFKLIKAADGSQPKASEAWAPEATLKRAK